MKMLALFFLFVRCPVGGSKPSDKHATWPTGRKRRGFLLNKAPVLTRVSTAKWIHTAGNHIPAGAEIIYRVIFEEAISNPGHQSTAEKEFKQASLFTFLKNLLGDVVAGSPVGRELA